jgi:hypothetical protein
MGTPTSPMTRSMSLNDLKKQNNENFENGVKEL